MVVYYYSNHSGTVYSIDDSNYLHLEHQLSCLVIFYLPGNFDLSHIFPVLSSIEKRLMHFDFSN